MLEISTDIKSAGTEACTLLPQPIEPDQIDCLSFWLQHNKIVYLSDNVESDWDLHSHIVAME